MGRGEVKPGSPSALDSGFLYPHSCNTVLRGRKYRTGERRKGERRGGDIWSQSMALKARPPPFLSRAGRKLGKVTDPGVLKPRLMSSTQTT